jgi:hypothetical protein
VTERREKKRLFANTLATARALFARREASAGAERAQR